jgi:hypothetical protein
VFITIKEKLASGEKVFLDKKIIESRFELVKNVSLHRKLEELEEIGVVRLKKSPRKGRPKGGCKWSFKGRFLKMISGYQGPSKWNNSSNDLDIFKEPYDLAIDPKTQTIVACAIS